MGNKSKNISIIDNGLVIEGKISCKGRLIINGTVKGTLEGETIVIGKEGSVYTNAKVTSITIGGTYEGEIRASEELILLSTGICSGKVVCRNLVVEAGGVLNAEVNCITIKESNSGKILSGPEIKEIQTNRAGQITAMSCLAIVLKPFNLEVSYKSKRRYVYCYI